MAYSVPINIEQFSIECNTKTKAITMANHSERT